MPQELVSRCRLRGPARWTLHSRIGRHYARCPGPEQHTSAMRVPWPGPAGHASRTDVVNYLTSGMFRGSLIAVAKGGHNRGRAPAHRTFTGTIFAPRVPDDRI